MPSQAALPAAPAQGAALSAAEQRARCLELLARLDAQAAASAARRTSYHLALALSPTEKQYEPAHDPIRWQGFL